MNTITKVEKSIPLTDDPIIFASKVFITTIVYQPKLSTIEKIKKLIIYHPEGGYFELLFKWRKHNRLRPFHLLEVENAYKEIFNN